MTSTSLLGTEAKSFIEWFNWKTEHLGTLLDEQSELEDNSKYFLMTCWASNIYSQPITEETDFNKLFKGEWEIIEYQDRNLFWIKWLVVDGKKVIRVSEMKDTTLNDLITNSPVKLEWNEFEI